MEHPWRIPVACSREEGGCSRLTTDGSTCACAAAWISSSHAQMRLAAILAMVAAPLPCCTPSTGLRMTVAYTIDGSRDHQGFMSLEGIDTSSNKGLVRDVK